MIKREVLNEIRGMDFDYLLNLDELELILGFGDMHGYAKRPTIELMDPSLHLGDINGRMLSTSLYAILREWLEADADCHETNEPSDKLIAIFQRCIKMVEAHQRKLARLYEANKKEHGGDDQQNRKETDEKET
jgi:hypothetical protein